MRRIVPCRSLNDDRGPLWYGSTQWHPEPQWLLHAFDTGCEAYRDFAWADIKAIGQEAVASALASTDLETVGGDGLSLTALHVANIARQAEWCPEQVPDLSFRGNELAGEAGETSEALILHAAEISRAAGRASNVVKKLERERYGWRGSRAMKADLADELADMVICADLCAVTAGIDLSAAVVAKFNGTSEKQGLTTKLPAAAPAAP